MTRLNRRQYLAYGGAAAATAAAGCIDRPGGSDPSTFTMAGVLSGENEAHLWDGVGSYGHGEFQRRLEARSDTIEASYAGDETICGEADCPESVTTGVVEVGGASIGNSTGKWPSNDVFLIPYTFPTPASIAHTITREETWERYWVPFAEEHGVVPFFLGTPYHRQLFVGQEYYDPDRSIRTPDDVEGLSVRRTQSANAATAFSTWGANPQSLSWGDTVEGLRTGVVDATETWGSATAAFGMSQSIAEVVVTDWTIGYQGWWASVDWLQSLDDGQRETLAEICRGVTEDSARLQSEIVTERIGQTDPPAEGTVFAEDDVAVTMLDADERDAWREPVDPQSHPELYDQIFEYVDDIGVDGKAFHDYLWNTARADETPTDVQDVSVTTWWDEYLDDL